MKFVKTELLLVLEHPEIPLHNNLVENVICEYVKDRIERINLIPGLSDLIRQRLN
jgi:hypothetical protein